MCLDKWSLKIDCDELVSDHVSYIKSLPDKIPSISWVWSEMDRVWDDCGLDNSIPIKKQNVGSFYSHPVWIMNGLFTEVDPDSKKHRESIAEYFQRNNLFLIADYGGGSGVLAKAMIEKNVKFDVDIVEPFAFVFFKDRMKNLSSVSYVSDFRNEYDAAIAQDVLEHVDDPIETAYNICNNVKVDGFIVFANCFHPHIRCHLPPTFYLRHTFKWVMRRMGLDYVGRVPGAEHALVFRKTRSLSLNKAQIFGKKIQTIAPLLNRIWPVLGKMKRSFQ